MTALVNEQGQVVAYIGRDGDTRQIVVMQGPNAGTKLILGRAGSEPTAPIQITQINPNNTTEVLNQSDLLGSLKVPGQDAIGIQMFEDGSRIESTLTLSGAEIQKVFDTENQLVSRSVTTRNLDGSTTEQVFDGQSNLQKTTTKQVFDDGSSIRSTTNNVGVVETLTLDSDNQLVSKSVLARNPDGSTTEQVFDGQNHLQRTTTKQVFDDGSSIQSTTNGVGVIETLTLDSDNQLVSKTITTRNPDGSLSEQLFDGQNHLQKTTTTSVFEDGSAVQTTTITVENASGEILNQVVVNEPEDGPLTVTVSGVGAEVNLDNANVTLAAGAQAKITGENITFVGGAGSVVETSNGLKITHDDEGNPLVSVAGAPLPANMPTGGLRFVTGGADGQAIAGTLSALGQLTLNQPLMRIGNALQQLGRRRRCRRSAPERHHRHCAGQDGPFFAPDGVPANGGQLCAARASSNFE